MNLNNNDNVNQLGCCSIPTSFNHSTVDSRSLSTFQKLLVNENPVPQSDYTSHLFLVRDKALMDLSLSQWENEAESDRHPLQQPKISTAKVA
mmetsp:Transcript_29970/g.44313  ORF Transcript_29970/g.44313 Transcript_29970/m.44313 type:complete len:92 (-) Transcript_29970:222-497(-)